MWSASTPSPVDTAWCNERYDCPAGSSGMTYTPGQNFFCKCSGENNYAKVKQGIIAGCTSYVDNLEVLTSSCETIDYSPYISQCVTCTAPKVAGGEVNRLGGLAFSTKCVTCQLQYCSQCSDDNFCSICQDGYKPKNGVCKKISPIKWWLWLIIGLVAAAFIALIIFVIVYCCCCRDVSKHSCNCCPCYKKPVTRASTVRSTRPAPRREDRSDDFSDDDDYSDDDDNSFDDDGYDEEDYDNTDKEPAQVYIAGPDGVQPLPQQIGADGEDYTIPGWGAPRPVTAEAPLRAGGYANDATRGADTTGPVPSWDIEPEPTGPTSAAENGNPMMPPGYPGPQ
ncbi:hypothetical protein AGDE_16598 [Angomonas deanei]|uniref:Uncharacterized protein n=1 Tax=Angomonas deanei TaxID=59799 RepID=A0A7G2C3I7_9TRYP|nr:hypothetical protein AGDE_16598 [Angomonas deanei]CAD2213711.1 hypothetical protein, conserved [Angomonas deanei]|eukprot:EPY16818.1 hypothetical protein AGDE_16598 [Angomonas deanei]